MAARKEKSGAKGKRPTPRGKGKPAESPAPAALSFSEDELDEEQRAVLEQLLAMERAHGIEPEEPEAGT